MLIRDINDEIPDHKQRIVGYKIKRRIITGDKIIVTTLLGKEKTDFTVIILQLVQGTTVQLGFTHRMYYISSKL